MICPSIDVLLTAAARSLNIFGGGVLEFNCCFELLSEIGEDGVSCGRCDEWYREPVSSSVRKPFIRTSFNGLLFSEII